MDEHRREVKPPFFHTYTTLSRAVGVRHLQFPAALAPPCQPAALRGAPPEEWLRCNLTVSAATLARGVSHVVHGRPRTLFTGLGTFSV